MARHYLPAVLSAVVLAACTPDPVVSASDDMSPAPSASPSASPSPEPSPDVTVLEGPPPPEPGEGEGENDPGPGYIDTSFVYPAELVDATTILPGSLGNYVHFTIFLDATSTAPGPNGVTHNVCVASFNGFHDCVALDIGDTMVPLDVYVEPGFNLHFGVSDSATPMAGAFYFFHDFPDQPAFTAGKEIWLEAIVKFDGTQNGFGIYLPTLQFKD